ncbi:hypothetical protein F5X68DRAFT_258761 [Plectosphaerella plurivora]|uniref:GPI anchored serine-threonine rich protein n=1 Tax=Plectosphaerella plurivora TaxID=936078 RepID=A0A9P8VJP6_9PEZI|nr:hypothetical protein F5X68DRAFT_258761 [Plectosphaerella plurivora]
MILKNILVSASFLGAAYSREIVPCSAGNTPCGNECIPSSRICCEFATSTGTIHTACPVTWRCQNDGTCLPNRLKDGTPVCPEGLTTCGKICVALDAVCCNGGSHSCPKGSVCAPPPLNCGSGPASLGTPRDQELPTTAADFTLPQASETTTTGEPEQTASSSLLTPSGAASSSAETSTALDTGDGTGSPPQTPSPTDASTAVKGPPIRPSTAFAWAVSWIVVFLLA